MYHIHVPEHQECLMAPLEVVSLWITETYDESEDGRRPGGTRETYCHGVAVEHWELDAVFKALRENVPVAPLLEAARAEHQAALAAEQAAHQVWLAGLDVQGPGETWAQWASRLEEARSRWWCRHGDDRRETVLATVDRVRPAVEARARELREDAWLRGLLEGTITLSAVAWKGEMVVLEASELAETCEAVAHLREQVIAAWAEIAARSAAAITDEQRAEAAATWERHGRDIEEQRRAQAARAALDEAVRAAPEAKDGERLATLEVDKFNPSRRLIGRSGGKPVFIRGLPDWVRVGTLVAVADWQARGNAATGRFDGLRRLPRRASARRR